MEERKMNEVTLRKIIRLLARESEEAEKQIVVLKKEIAASPEGSLLTAFVRRNFFRMKTI